MMKIRINELARELEVKPHKIIDLLPDLGVTEKKTHSSSIDEDVAVLVKRHFGFDSPMARPASGESDTQDDHGEEVTTDLTAEEEKEPAIAEASTPTAAPAAAPSEAVKEAPAPAPAFGPVRPPASPLRPPLAGPLAAGGLTPQ